MKHACWLLAGLLIGCQGSDDSGGGGGGGGGGIATRENPVELEVTASRLSEGEEEGTLRRLVEVKIVNDGSGPIPVGPSRFQVATAAGLLVRSSLDPDLESGYCDESASLPAGAQHTCLLSFELRDDVRASSLWYDSGDGLTASADIPAAGPPVCASYCDRMGLVTEALPCPDTWVANHDRCMNGCEMSFLDHPCPSLRESLLGCLAGIPLGQWLCGEHGLLVYAPECEDEYGAVESCPASD